MTREDEEKREEAARDADGAPAHGAARSTPEDDADDAMSGLLKRALETRASEPRPPKDFLRGVQKRIRSRSRGKFYADGWSTSSSRVNHMLVAVIMLLVLALAYFALGPMGVSAH